MTCLSSCVWKRKMYGYKRTCMHWRIAWFHYAIKIVKEVQPNLKVAQDRQKKSYADLKRTPREFNVGDHVYLKVKSKKSSLSLGRCSKRAPRYCGPFEVLSKKVHDVFHVSLLYI